VSVSGQAGGCADYDCAEVALSVTGGSCGEVALSGEGSTRTAPDPYCETQCGWLPGVVAVSGTGSASAGDPNSAAVSGEGPASGGEVAVSGTGPAGACGGPEPVAVQGTYPQRPTTCPGIVPPILGGGVSGPGISAG
jgi:hypothetical protein